MRRGQIGQCCDIFWCPSSKCFLNSSAVFCGKISCSPIQMESTFSCQIESFSSPPALKSIKILYSGIELAINCPSQLRMLPRLGFTLTLSRFRRSATSVQYCFFAVMI